MLNIADGDIPLQYAVPDVGVTLAPPYRGGAVAVFDVQRVQRVLGKILGADDRPFVYGELTVTSANGRSFGSPVGNDGSFYFENLPAGSYTAVVENRTGRCTFTIELPVSSDTRHQSRQSAMHRRRRAMSTKRLLIMLALVIGTLYASDASRAAECLHDLGDVGELRHYNVFNGSDVDSTGTVTYRCNGSAHNVTVGLTQGASASFNPRQMQKGAEALTYNLFLDASRSTIWGDGTSGTSVHPGGNPPNNTNVNVTVYGRVWAGQDVSAGAFSDTVTAVVNF